jgi:hypothetical protein
MVCHCEIPIRSAITVEPGMDFEREPIQYLGKSGSG